MCGIAGYINQNSRLNNQDILSKMLDKLRDRGPDHQIQYHPYPNIHLGYTRFIINDTEKGNQPFLNETKNIACFFNGEIYNWKEIREWLIRRGHHFKSECDGEVLPYLYEEYGTDFVKKLEGMYAISILDLKNHKLLLARDRIGEKPLYYAISPEFFLFSSTIPPLLASGLINKDLDLQSIAEFFTFRCVPYTNSVLKSVKRLEPASVLIFDYGIWKLSYKIYWKPELYQPLISSEEKAIEELENLLFNSIKSRTDTDGGFKIGTALSGGIDSSTVTALSRKFQKERELYTFSVHVKDDPEDLDAIRTVARKVKTKHHWIDCNTTDINLLPSILAVMGEPISAGMTIPSYQCYKEARRKNVKVLFCGDGSDELFAGYSGRLIMDGILKKWDTLDAKTRTNYLRECPILAEKIKSKLNNPSLSVLDRYTIWDDDNCFDLDIRAKLLQGTKISDLDPLIRLRELEQLTAGVSHENAMLFLELKTRLEGFMIVILDRTSMACPVECRSPYLDSKIVDLAFRISPELKFAKGIEKYILRRVSEKAGILPEKILWRKKHPFSGPIKTWLDNLPPNLKSLLSPKRLDNYGFVNSKFVSQIYKEYKTGNQDRQTRIKHSDLLFAVLVLTLWLEIFLQNRSVDELSTI